jgi:SAM-dependent methyltransferase
MTVALRHRQRLRTRRDAESQRRTLSPTTIPSRGARHSTLHPTEETVTEAAAQVLGVDISPEMIRLAQQQEQAKPLGTAYQVGDAVVFPRLDPFDMVMAVYLLHRATSQEH